MELNLGLLYGKLSSAKGVARLRLQKQIDIEEERLSWQGANPKDVPFADLAKHVRAAHNDDPIENKYQLRIKNRATAIRAYCVICQGGSTSGVKLCPSVTCALYPFRMGSDPLRGYAMPKAPAIVIEADDDDDNMSALFEDGDDGDDADATD